MGLTRLRHPATNMLATELLLLGANVVITLVTIRRMPFAYTLNRCSVVAKYVSSAYPTRVASQSRRTLRSIGRAARKRVCHAPTRGPSNVTAKRIQRCNLSDPAVPLARRQACGEGLRTRSLCEVDDLISGEPRWLDDLAPYPSMSAFDFQVSEGLRRTLDYFRTVMG